MGFDVFRPHWRHARCGGVVVSIDNSFQCTACDEAGAAIAAILPGDIENRREYFLSHPELDIQLMTAADAAAYEAKRLRRERFAALRVQSLRWLKEWSGFR